MGSVRRFSWPLDPTSDETNCDYNSNDLTTGRYIDIDNINLVVRLQTYVDDIIGTADRQTVCGKHCNQNCRLHWRRNTCRTSQPTPLQTPPTQRSANGLIARYDPNVNNEVVIDMNDNTNANTVTDIKVPIVKSLISRFKSSSTSTTSDSSTTCSSCRARQSISSNSSASSSCGRSAAEAGHVIANQNILTNSLSDTSSDSEIVSDMSDFSDDHNSSHTSDLMFNELILGELSEMRQILEEILSNRDQLGSDFNQSNTEELFKLFGFSLSDVKHLVLSERSGDFPTGPWTYAECGICLEVGWLNKRHCCDYCACIQCLQQYYSSRVELGSVTIECINPFCRSFVHRDEIAARLTAPIKDVYHRLLLTTSSQSEQTKPCPQCNYFYTLSDDLFKQYKSKTRDSTIFRVQCTECQFYWCFKCHSPWHSELSCKQYRKGDRLLKTWAKETNHGQVNAQKCPRCGIYIQRTSGCDHMHCTRCKTDFCYKCGDRLRRLKFFGDHYSKLSIFGCKYRYKASQPVQRKLIRGAVFGSKLMLVPVLGSLAVCAGAVVLVLGVAALPVYGAVKIYRKYRNKKNLKSIRQQVVTTISSTPFD